MHEQPIDPDIVALMSSEPEPSESVSVSDLTADQLRQMTRDMTAIFTSGTDPVSIHRITDELVPGRDGNIAVRIYSPETPTAVMVYMHGGAWIAGDIETHDHITRRFSHDIGAVVVSVDYRMLPEDPFPTPFDDAFAAVVWASALHPGLPLIVAGDSAGGTLAACVALRARDEDGPRIDAQILAYPAIDDAIDTPSMLAFSEGALLTREDLGHLIDQYASSEAALGSSYALPGRATSLDGLPQAVVVIAGHDLLRSSEEEYARRLQDAGVVVTVQLDHELVHGWFEFAPCVPSADRAFTRLTDTIKDVLDLRTTRA